MRIAIDVGGTFTDFAWEVDGKIHTGKVPTTRPHPSAGVFNGVDALMGDLLKEAPWVIHASTLASNTAIERTGAETAVLTTSGFRDVLLIGRQKRYDVYDVSIRRPQPLVQRRRIREVDERTAADGSIVRPLAEEQVIELAQELEKAGVESVAICFLNSYASNEHEQQARSLLAEAAPALYVSTSGDVAPQWREYERFSTTVLNAYLGPILANYLASVKRGLEDRGFRGQLLVMQSSGGVAPAETMERYPVRLLESGPAAGVLMAADLSRRLGIANLLSFDMGGTTAKVGLIQGGVVNVTDSFEIAQIDLKPRSGLPVMIPSVDVIEIGAGGGSIARAVRGLIEVGPRSAGADPGPACYARGGDQPTVTDADLVLGYLNADYFAGGTLRLDQEMGNKAVKTLGDGLNIGLIDAAWSIHHIVNINMATCREGGFHLARDRRKGLRAARIWWRRTHSRGSNCRGACDSPRCHPSRCRSRIRRRPARPTPGSTSFERCSAPCHRRKRTPSSARTTNSSARRMTCSRAWGRAAIPSTAAAPTFDTSDRGSKSAPRFRTARSTKPRFKKSKRRSIPPTPESTVRLIAVVPSKAPTGAWPQSDPPM